MADFNFINPITSFTQPVIGTGTSAVVIDFTERVEGKFTQEVTSNKVEGNSDLSDHIITRPTEISFVGKLTDLPVSNLVGVYTSGSKGLSKSKFSSLLSKFVGKKTFPVMDGLFLYKSMQFTDLKYIKENADFSISFSATLKQVRTEYATTLGRSSNQELYRLARIFYSTYVGTATGSLATSDLKDVGIVL